MNMTKVEEHKSRELMWMMDRIETTEKGDTMRVQVGNKEYTGKATCDAVKKEIGGWYFRMKTASLTLYVHGTPSDCWVHGPDARFMGEDGYGDPRNRVQRIECLRKWDEPYGEEGQ